MLLWAVVLFVHVCVTLVRDGVHEWWWRWLRWIDCFCFGLWTVKLVYLSVPSMPWHLHFPFYMSFFLSIRLRSLLLTAKCAKLFSSSSALKKVGGGILKPMPATFMHFLSFFTEPCFRYFRCFRQLLLFSSIFYA